MIELWSLGLRLRLRGCSGLRFRVKVGGLGWVTVRVSGLGVNGVGV